MVDWDKWQTLLAIFRCGTYSGAAKVLGVDSTTVGRRLKHLEKYFGYALIVRRDAKLYPTTRCEQLLAHIETAAEALHAAEQKSGSSEGGAVMRSLRLNALPYLCTKLLAPMVGELLQQQRIRIELMGTVTRLNLSRREADIVIRLSEKRPEVDADILRIGDLSHAVYCANGVRPETLSWAGVIEDYIDTPDGQAMIQLVGSDGFQIQAYQYDAVYEIAVTGAAKSMLPRFIADQDPRLQCISDTVYTCPLWMLSHPQDREVPHLKAAREWVHQVACNRLITAPSEH